MNEGCPRRFRAVHLLRLGYKRVAREQREFPDSGFRVLCSVLAFAGVPCCLHIALGGK